MSTDILRSSRKYPRQTKAAGSGAAAHIFQRKAMTKVSAVAKTTQASSKSLLLRGSYHRYIFFGYRGLCRAQVRYQGRS